MKYLILLNRKFPYESGETFLENEIDEISMFFDKVIIFPSDMTSKNRITRKIKSPNVEVIIFEKHSLKVRNLEYLMYGIFETKDSTAKGIKQKLYSGYFEAAADLQSKDIIRVLSQMHFQKEDEIIVYSYWLFITARVAINLKKYFGELSKVKCISRAHNFDIYEEKKFLPQRKFLLENLDAIFPCSENGSNYLKAKYPEYNDKIYTSYLGTYDYGRCDKMPSQTFKIISCSRVAPVKRLDLLIDSLKLLRSIGVSFSWTHLGGGELFEHIKARAYKELDFMEVNLPGMISNMQVYEYYKNNYYDVFVNVSSAEGLPVSIMEAASFGIPTIATDVGGSSEIVKNGITGYVLEPHFQTKQLADILKKFALKSSDERQLFHEETRKMWCKKFQAKQNYRKFVDQIEKI